jgi:acyl-CoA thioester hydrolase
MSAMTSPDSSSIVPPAGFTHGVPIQVRWGDLDAMGHVNNATYLTYLEQARVTYFDDLGLWDGSGGGLGLIMARAEIDYRLPIRARDAIIVYTRCTRLGTRSFDTEQLVARVDDGGALTIAAQARIVVVVYDYGSGQSAPIPDAWRARLSEHNPGL